MVVFLVDGDSISYSSIDYILLDFIEQAHRDERFFTTNELRELRKIKQDKEHFTKSYMFEQIKHFCIPYIEQTRKFFKHGRDR